MDVEIKFRITKTAAEDARFNLSEWNDCESNGVEYSSDRLNLFKCTLNEAINEALKPQPNKGSR